MEDEAKAEERSCWGSFSDYSNNHKAPEAQGVAIAQKADWLIDVILRPKPSQVEQVLLPTQSSCFQGQKKKGGGVKGGVNIHMSKTLFSSSP